MSLLPKAPTMLCVVFLAILCATMGNAGILSGIISDVTKTSVNEVTQGAIGDVTQGEIGAVTQGAIGGATQGAIGGATQGAIGAAMQGAIGAAMQSAIGRVVTTTDIVTGQKPSIFQMIMNFLTTFGKNFFQTFIVSGALLNFSNYSSWPGLCMQVMWKTVTEVMLHPH